MLVNHVLPASVIMELILIDNIMVMSDGSMLGGSFVTMAWHMLRLDRGNGHQLWRIAANILSSPAQLTGSGPPTGGLDMG
jgi:hypothetical protein